MNQKKENFVQENPNANGGIKGRYINVQKSTKELPYFCPIVLPIVKYLPLLDTIDYLCQRDPNLIGSGRAERDRQ